MKLTSEADTVLLFIACPPSIAFVLVYGLLQPWFKSWWGWALFVSTTGLSALLNINLIYLLSAWPVLNQEGWLRTGVYGFIALGTWLTLIALLVVLSRARQGLYERIEDHVKEPATNPQIERSLG